MSFTYSNVDASPNVGEAVDWQDRVNGWAEIRAYKQRTYELLGDARPVLDVGSGTGFDLGELGPGAVGVDCSSAMCERASARGCPVAVADCVGLPFADATFAGVRADRVLQHVVSPHHALAEMVRVTKPGGRVVIADPDQETLGISVPGVDPALVAEVKRMRRDHGYRNGELVRSLPGVLEDLHLADVTVEGFPLVLTDPDLAFGLPTWLRFWRDEGPFDDAQIESWDAGIERGRHGGFVYALLYFVVSARKP
ncbi:MAG: methyltransferase domain-containing protein [Acidimicrobiia bacterium]